MFSKACEYAIKAMIYIEAYGKEMNLSLKEISDAIDSPLAFTSKILQKLRKNALLESTKGVGGGFQIPNNKPIDLKAIVIAIDGDNIFKECVLGLKSCSASNPCPLHEKYQKVKYEVLHIMSESFLKDFSAGIKAKSIKLK